MKSEITTTTEPPRQKQSALATMAAKYHVEPAALLSTLKDTAFKGATDSQMMALCVVANEYGLNPFTKEIYAFPDSKSGGIVPIIGVDGWYRIVNDNPAFDGCEFDVSRPGDKLESITCRIYRKDRSKPVEVTEYLDECKRNTPPWNNQPVRMLRHRSFVQCARVAFGLSFADPEDAERMKEYHDAAPRDRAEAEAARVSFEAPAMIVESIEVEGGEA
jgi:phage recombination protein Bet